MTGLMMDHDRDKASDNERDRVQQKHDSKVTYRLSGSLTSLSDPVILIQQGWERERRKEHTVTVVR